MVKNLSSIPRLGRSPGEASGNHSSILASIIPWNEESMGWQRVGHHRATNTFTFKHEKTTTQIQIVGHRLAWNLQNDKVIK